MSTLAHTVSDSRTMLRRNLKHAVRYPIITYLIATPVIFLLLFVYVFGATLGTGIGGTGTDAYLNYVVPGVLLLAITGGVTGPALSVSKDLTEGIIARFRTMNISRSAVLTGHVLGNLIQVLIAVTVVLAIALLMGFRAPADVLGWLGAAGLLVAIGYALCWLGAATRADGTARGLLRVHPLEQLRSVAGEDEQRVVDADREPEHQRERRDRVAQVDEPGGRGDPGEADPDAERRGQQRQAGGEQRPERERQHERGDAEPQQLADARLARRDHGVTAELDLHAGLPSLLRRALHGFE